MDPYDRTTMEAIGFVGKLASKMDEELFLGRSQIVSGMPGEMNGPPGYILNFRHFVWLQTDRENDG